MNRNPVGRLIGRERELAKIASFLEGRRKECVSHLLRVIGVSGIGKTALVQQAVEEAAAAGWMTTISTAHRTQAALPFVLARRLAAALLDRLNDDAGARYASGLENELAAAGVPDDQKDTALEIALFHLIEAMLLDQPVLLVIDDAQWSDI
ncbi:MAG TPA: ATP-binding protein, partial [Candidatus Baltobacteraceae bacterium]|nr:ATP-binding protein [Candidatus Baltobacteraceae bacterium]